MKGTIVDSNVLLDILTNDALWEEWSTNSLARCADEGPLYINSLIYAEVSISFTTIEDMEKALPDSVFQRLPLPMEATFLAGKAYLQYRKRGGIRSSTLPDFFIGAHAAVTGLRLLTRDVSRYRTYFPAVALVTPEK